MIILGMHFGHDGAVSIIKDGKVLSYISRERTSRVKHAIGITTNELDLALEEAQISVDDIDYCTVVSTQNMEILNGLINDFSISFENHKDHKIEEIYNNKKIAIYDVIILGSDNFYYEFKWQVERYDGKGSLNNCWLTTAVSNPVSLGASI